MSDSKEKFRHWLLSQKCLPNTVNQYIHRIDKICRENYVDGNWDRLYEDIFYFMAQYSEYANKEYYLDFITIEYALTYFENFFKKIHKPKYKTKDDRLDVRLYIYHDKKDYFVDSIDFNNLHSHLNILNYILYAAKNTDIKACDLGLDEFENKLNVILRKNMIKPNKKLAVHIVYSKNVSTKKTALSKYFSFLQSAYSSNLYFTGQVSFIKDIKEKNPNKTIDGHYKIKTNISGKTPLEVEACHENQRLNTYFTLTKKDLTQIFNLDIDTVSKLLDEARIPNNHTVEYDKTDYISVKSLVKHYVQGDAIVGFETEIRTYYSADNINEYLKNHHYFHDNSKNQASIYMEEGYAYWCNRKEALKILRIGKGAFYMHSYGLTHISYTPYTTKYYIPELKIIKYLPKFKRIQMRNKQDKTNRYK